MCAHTPCSMLKLPQPMRAFTSKSTMPRSGELHCAGLPFMPSAEDLCAYSSRLTYARKKKIASL